MKNLYLFLVLFIFPMNAMDKSYRNNSQASLVPYNEQIILNRYYQLQELKKIPQAYLAALAKVGHSQNTIKIFTATHMKNFIEKVGNNIILNNPDFFKHMNEEEQATIIGLEFKWEQVLPLLYKSCDDFP